MLTAKPLWRQAELLRDGQVSSVDLTKEYLDRIGKLEGEIGSYISLDAESALRQAQQADTEIGKGDAGPMTGLPLAIKDVLMQKGQPATCGSKILEGFIAPYDGTAVARLRQAGAVFLGRANMDEFAMGSSNEFSAYKVVRNPWNMDYVPGGSSGGSAAAVAACLAGGALGTDTGGSVRQPAALTGIVGLKPTYGRVSRYGLIAFGSSLDCIGPMTRCVRDAALLLGTIAGHDPLDSTSLDEPVEDYVGALDGSVEGLRIGVPRESRGEGVEPGVLQAFETSLETLESMGATIKEISLENMKHGIPAYYIIACAEASSNLSRFDGIRYGLRKPGYDDMLDQYFTTRTAGFGPEVKRRIMLGAFVLSSGYYDAYYRKSTLVRKLITQELLGAFDQVDLIATPTSPSTAWKIGERVEDPLKMYLADLFTVSANLAGLPALSLNCGFDEDNGLPIGIQLSAPHLQEARLLRAADALELALDLETEGPLNAIND